MGIMRERIEKVRKEGIRAKACVLSKLIKTKRSDTEMVRPCGQKVRRRCGNENMDDGIWVDTEIKEERN